MSGPVPIPEEVSLDKHAGHHDLVIVKVRIWGEEFPFLIDTGCPGSIFDKSLAGRMGPRVGTTLIHHFSETQKFEIHATPEIFLGATRLKTGQRCLVGDMKKLTAHDSSPPMGILGMDCLSNYCIQFDFETEKMTFLPSGHVDAGKFDQNIPIVLSGRFYPAILNGALLGGGRVWVDTGCRCDGMVGREALKQMEKEKFPGIQAKADGRVRIEKLVWNKATYTNLLVVAESMNILGLDFLARHRVVLDFPAGKMYLKQTSIGPVCVNDYESVVEMARSGVLPGMPKNTRGKFDYRCFDANSVDLEIHKKKDPCIYHYKLVRKAFGAPWTMEQGWRTDQNNKKLEDYLASQTDAAK